MRRGDLFTQLRSQPDVDLIVIGGGATGLGTALDAQTRGLRTLLVEAEDFAKGTSSRSTKLIHGGVRYLGQGNISLVREALRERAILLRNAPHLIHPLGFVLPGYRWWEKYFYGVGLKFYDALAAGHGMQSSRLLSKAETQRRMPTLRRRDLRGGVLYYDGQFDDAGLAVALLRTLWDKGGVALNYVRAVQLLKTNGKVSGVVLRDEESGASFPIQAHAVVNATGVQVDEVRRLDDGQVKPLVRPSQGIHLVVDASFLPGDEAVLIPSTEDGRVLFMVPWLGKVLLGTTDTPRKAINTEPRALEEEIDFVLRTCAGYLSRPPMRSDVRSVFAGLRPLVQNNDSHSTARLSREHTIATSASGLITVTGGKWTTYRRMAADVVDEVVAHTGLAAKPCQTETLRLHGAESGNSVDRYGADRAVLAALAGFDRLLHQRLDLTEAHVRFACRLEAARTVEDVLARRHRALFLDAQAAREAARPVARLMAAELGHDAQWIEQQVQAFEALTSGYEVAT